MYNYVRQATGKLADKANSAVNALDSTLQGVETKMEAKASALKQGAQAGAESLKTKIGEKSEAAYVLAHQKVVTVERQASQVMIQQRQEPKD